MMDFILSLFSVMRSPDTQVELFFATPSVLKTLMAIALLLLPAVVLLYLTLRPFQQPRQWILFSLRLFLLCILTLLLLKPAAVLLSPITLRDRVALLLDNSQSMSIGVKAGQPSRWDNLVKEVTKGEVSRRLETFDLEWYTFGSTLTSLPGIDALPSVNPADENTDLSQALEALTRDGRDLALGAIVLGSDGIDRGPLRRQYKDGGESALKTALGTFLLPIHVVVPKNEGEFVDLAIEQITYNEFAFLRQPFKVMVNIAARNLSGKPIQVRLLRSGQLLGHRSLVLPADGQNISVEFEITPEKVGKFTYTIDIPVLSGEAIETNNRRSFTLKVVRDKIRVLQVAGAPSWDVKYLRRLLKSDPNIDLVSFFILREPSDPTRYRSEDYSLIEFPYQDLFDKEKDLKSFDVVVFQNFAYAPYLREHSTRLLSSLADYVRQGGGLAMFGGDLSFAAGGYAGSPLEEVLPVRLDRSPSVISGSTRLTLTEQGLRHPVTVLHFSPDMNKNKWDQLPPLDGYNTASTWPDSVVLATTGDSAKAPLLVVREVERGRTLALLTDTSWYWAFRAAGEGKSNLSYLLFWKNTLRWLVGDPDENQIQVDTERENYRLGETTMIQVKVVGADYSPVANVPLELSIVSEDHPEHPIIVQGTAGPSGEWSHAFDAKIAGPYRAKAAVRRSTKIRGEAETVFTVNEVGPEMKDLLTDAAFLEALARVSGGSVLTGTTEENLVLNAKHHAALTQRQVFPLWDRYPPYVALLGLLGLDWYLRRRWAFR